MTRHRILSIACALTLALSIAAFLALRQAQPFQIRGTPLAESASGYALPVRGAETLLAGVNAALEQYDPQRLDAVLSDLADRGITAVRQEFRWSEIEKEKGVYDWSSADRIVAAARRNGIRLLPVLWTTPAWARGPSGSAQFPATATAPPQDPGDFASFARAFAQRYEATSNQPSPFIAYQIWDEPNLSAAWGDALINPAAYLRLLQSAGDAIRRVNPQARIALAALAPTVVQSDVNLAPQAYLRRLYELGGKDAFDVAAAKPYGFEFPPDDRRVDAGLLNFSHAILMREEMLRQGDGGKAIWLTQFGWNAALPAWKGDASPWSGVSEGQQADYTVGALRRAAAEWPWAGAMFLETLQPNRPATDPRWGFALLDPQDRPRAVLESFTQALEALKTGQMPAPRAQAFAVCDAAKGQTPADCFGPNPRAEFSPEWRFGELGADVPQREDARVRFDFVGDALALIVRRGDYRAYTFVSVDGRPANGLPIEPAPDGRGAYLIMTSPDLAPRIETIEVASGLGEGRHMAELHVDRGWNQWSLLGWSSRVAAPPPIAGQSLAGVALAVLGLVALAGLVYTLPSARWGDAWRTARRTAGRGGRASTAMAVAAAIVYWIGASLAWAQDAATAYRNLGLPANIVISGAASGVLFWSPAMVVSLGALAVLAVLVVLRLEAGLVVLAFVIPFYLIPQRLFARAFSMTELLTILCLASWTIGRLRQPARLRGFVPSFGRFTLLDWSVLALVAVALLSAVFAEFGVEALREFRVVILESALLYLMLRTTPLRQSDLNAIAAGFLAGATSVALVGLFSYARGDVFPAEGGLPRIKSVWGSPNNDALFLGRAWPLLLAVTAGLWLALRDAATRRVRLARLLALASFAVVSLALLLTQSRGALLLGLPAAVIAMSFAAGGRWRWLGVGLAVAAAAGLALLLSGALAPLLQGTRFAQALDPGSGTGFFRLNLWRSALEMWRDHPLLGVGPDNFLYAYRGTYISPAAWQEPNLSHAHNLFFDPLARLGALGLAAWLGMCAGLGALLARGLRRRRDPASRVLLIGLVGVLADTLAHGLVDNSFFLVDLAFVFMLIAGLAAKLAEPESVQPAA